jgi:hypothetical protein
MSKYDDATLALQAAPITGTRDRILAAVALAALGMADGQMPKWLMLDALPSGKVFLNPAQIEAFTNESGGITAWGISGKSYLLAGTASSILASITAQLR